VFGLVLRTCLPHQRKFILHQLIHTQNALGIETQQLVELERLHWIDLGRRVGEWLAGTKALSLFWISPAARKILHEAYLSAQAGRGLVVCTAHYGHWELMAAWLSHQDYYFLAVASSLPRGPFGAWLDRKRKSMGVKVIHPRGGARSARRHLESGGVVAILVDHATAERSIKCPFLGQEAPHAETTDRLAHTTQATTLWVCSRRDPTGRYEVVVHPLTDQRRTPEDPIPNVREAHIYLEQLIIESPQQWLWFHRRWADRTTH